MLSVFAGAKQNVNDLREKYNTWTVEDGGGWGCQAESWRDACYRLAIYNLVLGISIVENRSSDCSEDMQKQLDAAETP